MKNTKKLKEVISKIIKEELKENPSVDVVKNLSQNYVALKRAMDDPSYPSTAHTKAALIKIENKIKQMCQNEKIKQMFMNTIPRALVNILKENQPQTSPSTAPSKPNIQPGIKPGTPGTDKPKPRRPLGNPNVQPKPKASLKEEEMLNKIVARFKNKKINEDVKFPGDNKWQEGYKTGYKEGFLDGKLGKKNKFLNENKITAEEFFRNKIKELKPELKSITLANEMITAEQGMRWAYEFSKL